MKHNHHVFPWAVVERRSDDPHRRRVRFVHDSRQAARVFRDALPTHVRRRCSVKRCCVSWVGR